VGRDGIELRIGAATQAVEGAGGRVRLTLEMGEQLAAERVVVAVGRAPRTDVGLETVGLRAEPRGIPVDERCRAGDGVWAVGDVTGAAPFTPSPPTRAGSRRPTCSGARRGPTTARSRGWSSQIPRWRPSA
jgi:pyruvate/2-oxoglutarate dehydrogenase complex dihydrolipoamide dehydrogenase (E3) component